MNIETTMQFILKTQARAEVRAEKSDRRIDSLTKLVQQGMRMIIQIQAQLKEMGASLRELAASQKELAASQKELAASQKETDRELKALVKSLRYGRNGRNGHA